jgi:hypothetical protein
MTPLTRIARSFLAAAAVLLAAPAFAATGITIVAAPSSAYSPASASAGYWHFDESTGTAAADSSGNGDTGALVCTGAGCISTPTWVSGPAGLGSALSFSGVAGSLVRVPDTGSFAFTDNLTVSAWVNPATISQPNGAGIIVRGNGGAETFALDVSGGLYRFTATPAKIVSSTNSIASGVWIHVMGVHDSAAGTATLYINGRQASTVAGVPLRSGVGHEISIGNRQSAAASYDRGFIGSIDAVRVQHKALTAGEALAEFEGAFVSTVAAAAPNDVIHLGLAPNAFGAPANISVSVDPFTFPITITPTILNAGLTVVPSGFMLVPNSIVEVVPYVAGVPFTGTLGSSASVSKPYNDVNGDNIIDGVSPPLAASAIKVYTLNTTVNRWELLPSYIDPAARRVTAFTPHFSVFGLFAPATFGAALSQARVYPIPWKPGSGGRFDAPVLTFDRLPATGTVRIINLAGERLREFSFDGSAAGTFAWDGRTETGRRAANGVYFARITGGGSEALVKFAIER